jgi:hypothetical protein
MSLWTYTPSKFYLSFESGYIQHECQLTSVLDKVSIQIPAAHPHFQLNHFIDLACHLRRKPSQAFELLAPFRDPEPHLTE